MKSYRSGLLFAFFLALSPIALGQIAKNYTVGTWSQFKMAAVSYTMDGYNNSPSKQLSVAVPLFDQYNYKVTLCTIPSWISNWTPLKNAANNGHEIASLTVDHTDLTTLPVPAQETELKQSQITINSNITNQKCVILAYPNCNRGDLATVQKYYIAGRTCAGTIIPSTPSDFYSLSSIMTGSAGNNLKADDMNNKVASAKNSKGWCNFLIHGIDTDGGFSPIPSSEISAHLDYMNLNTLDFWVAPFGNVVKYIKERNAATITETTITSDSLQMTLTDNLDNAVYNVPITIRRTMPANWEKPKVYINGKLGSSSLVTTNGTTSIQFDAIPNTGNVFFSNGRRGVVTELEKSIEQLSIKVEPNPFSQEATLEFRGDFLYAIMSFAGVVLESGTGLHTLQIGQHLSSGIYLILVSQGDKMHTVKMIKR